MQSLCDAPPEGVRIDGKCYALNTDWRTAVRALEMLEDGALAAAEKQGLLLALLYPRVPENTAEAVRLAVLFLNCGRAETPQAEDAPRLFSFTRDAPLIYAAMCRTHGAHVLDGPLHWYRFAALFSDIGEDTFFARAVYLRRKRAQGKLTPAERRAAAALGDVLETEPPTPTPEAQAFFAALRGADGAAENLMEPREERDAHG